MPPKRRRTTTAFSTALDNLRAKIRSFADTADEEQLREVTQLIDILGISNHGPFRLPDLPYELLEYTAERYFTRLEAAPILPVNRVFNELFANRVWKCVELDGTKVNGCKVPMHVLMKNVRRIRTAELGLIKPNFFVSGYFHYATSITFDIKKDIEMMFTLHLEQMKNLRHVTLRIKDTSNSVIDAAARWIDDSHRSGHVQQIVIRASYYPSKYHGIHTLASLMDMIKFKKRTRLDCAHREPFPNSIIQYMPATLTILNIAQRALTRCHGEINKQVFGADPESVFVHLRTLLVQVCCSNSSLYDFQSFVPERFPVLSYLAMCIPERCCNGGVGAPLATIFSNKQWPSITDLRLVGDNTMVPGIGRLLFEAMPALQRCTLQNMAEVDISSDPDTCLTISKLSLIGTSFETSHLVGKLPCLVYLELDFMDIGLNRLQLMASCKRLVEIKLTDCDITDDAIAALYKYPCNSVHKAVISKDKDDDFTDRIAHLLPAFPNIRILDLATVPEDKRMKFVLKCPTINIIT